MSTFLLCCCVTGALDRHESRLIDVMGLVLARCSTMRIDGQIDLLHS